MKTTHASPFAVAASHFFAVLIGGVTVALALLMSGCTGQVASEGEAVPLASNSDSAATLPSPPFTAPGKPIPQIVETCASYQGAWALLAPRCPDGTHPASGECSAYGGTLIASGLQGASNWGCQATHQGSESFSLCARVVCEY